MVVVTSSSPGLMSFDDVPEGRFRPTCFGRVMRISSRVIVLWVGIAGLLPSVGGSPLAAQEVISREYSTKAGVICLLGAFTTWPTADAPSNERPLTIGVLGKDPFLERGANQLEQAIDAERVKGRKIVLQRFDSAKDYKPCHVLYVSRDAAPNSVERTLKARLAAAVNLANQKPLLLVGDAEELATRGVAANMIYDRAANVIRLELNPEAAGRHKLKFDAQLLNLSVVQIVRDKVD